MKVAIIDLLRHGEVEGEPRLLGYREDPPLSERGWSQMWSLLDGASPPWQRVITSPLKRCAAFASEIADRYGLSLTYEQRFAEISLGNWEGQRLPELYENEGEQVQRFLNNPLETAPPGGETYQAFEERIWQAWDELLLTLNGQHCLVVTHGGPIRVILRRVLGIPVGRLHSIEVPHACLSRLRKEKDGSVWLVFHGRVP